MMRLILIAAALLGMAGSASAQYRSYGHSYGHRQSYGHSYGHSYYSAPTYSYSAPTYSYTAPTYSYSAPTYNYTWYDGTWYKGRWYKAGYYYFDGHCWYLKGYGAYYGEDKAAGPPPTKTHSGLSDEETAALRRLLAESEKPKTKPLSAAEVKRLKEVLDKVEE
jgi:hypothetical protein